REIEQQAIEGGNLEIVTNDNGEEWWSWHNGHALAVVASFWFHRYAKQGLILFDPMAGRLILEFEENIERWMYPEGERIKTVFFSEKFGMLSSMMYLAESQGTTFEEYCQRVFGG
ncbi:hypothetical protein KKB06_00660, partial [Patescibacteria group bacterium]|nr:hypothetical protein [Patescibacteria group bacterium]